MSGCDAIHQRSNRMIVVPSDGVVAIDRVGHVLPALWKQQLEGILLVLQEDLQLLYMRLVVAYEFAGA